MRKVAAVLLLIIVTTNILLPVLASRAEGSSKTESFWEKVEDKLTQYAYTMAEKRIFFDYFFIPGVGGGEQDLEGTGGLRVVMFLLPAIESETTESTINLLQKIITDSFKGALSELMNLKGIGDVISAFYDGLSKNTASFGENIVSFYLPYQKMMFRVIALVWIQSRSLLGAIAGGSVRTLTGITEEIMGPAYHFMYALKDKKLDELKRRINEDIDSSMDKLILYVSNWVSTRHEIGHVRIGNVTLYSVRVIAEPVTVAIFNEIASIMQTTGNLLRYYGSADQIIEGYEDLVRENATKSETSQEMYTGMFNKLKSELQKEVEKILSNNSIRIIIDDTRVEMVAFGFGSEKDAMNQIEELRKRANEECKNKLKNALEKIRDNYLKGPINVFLDSIKTTLEKMLNDVFNKAEKMRGEIIEDVAGEIGDRASVVVGKIPVVGAIYTVANVIHQIFTNTITNFQYEVEPPEGSLTQTKDGKIEYSSKMISGSVKNQQWWQGCIKGAMAGLIGMLSSEAKEVVDYIPQIFIFDIDFKDEKVITGGRPGIYLFNGRIKFKNVYSTISGFIGRVASDLAKSLEGNYSIFSDVIRNVLLDGEKKDGQSEKQTAVKFVLPYIVGSALPVVKDITKIDKDLISIKMAAILDFGSLIRPSLQEVKNEIESERGRAASSSDEVRYAVDYAVNTLINRIHSFFKETFINAIEERLIGRANLIRTPLEGIKEIILRSIVSKMVDHIFNHISNYISNYIYEQVGAYGLLENAFKNTDISDEKMGDIISITLSVLAIPARGMKGMINISIPLLGISKSVDGLGYCEIDLRKDSLIRFSMPVSATGSYVAFSSGASIGMIPYSTHSYEPFIVQVFAEVFPRGNVFNVRWISNPEHPVAGLSIDTSSDKIGTKLVLLRPPSTERPRESNLNTELRYVPNPYPYAEAYVSLNIAK